MTPFPIIISPNVTPSRFENATIINIPADISKIPIVVQSGFAMIITDKIKL